MTIAIRQSNSSESRQSWHEETILRTGLALFAGKRRRAVFLRHTMHDTLRIFLGKPGGHGLGLARVKSVADPALRRSCSTIVTRCKCCVELWQRAVPVKADMSKAKRRTRDLAEDVGFRRISRLADSCRDRV